jgi:SAM-dependent methyltransferase
VQIIGDAHCLPFASESFSGAVSTEVLEHVRDPQRMIDELGRILKPGGRLVLTTRFVFPLHDTPGDYYRFTDSGLRHLFRRWSHVAVTAETGSWETIGVLLQRLAFQSDFRLAPIVRPSLLVAARLISGMGRFVKAQYGNLAEHHRVDDILVSGWHVIAHK